MIPKQIYWNIYSLISDSPGLIIIAGVLLKGWFWHLIIQDD